MFGNAGAGYDSAIHPEVESLLSRGDNMTIDFGNIKFEVGCEVIPISTEFREYNAWAVTNGLNGLAASHLRSWRMRRWFQE